MIYTTTETEASSARARLREACAEIVREEAEAFRGMDTSGVVLDREYRAGREVFSIGTVSRKLLPLVALLALALIPTGLALAKREEQPPVSGIVQTTVPQTVETTDDEDSLQEVENVLNATGAVNSRSVTHRRSVFDFDWETQTVEADGTVYEISVSAGVREALSIRQISSDLAHVTVPGTYNGQEYDSTWAYLDGISIPNATKLTFEQGLRGVVFSFDNVEVSEFADQYALLEVLELPASLKTIFYHSERMEFLLMQDFTEIEPSVRGSGGNLWRAIKQATGYDMLCRTFPLALSHLCEIRVAEENAYFWDEDGILYGNSFVSLDVDESEYPQRQLICLPQDYQNVTVADGKTRVDIAEGTDYIHTGAVYECYIDELYLPASVTRIAPAAIVATYARPLTVIGQKDSAAEEYVKQFGEKYHLTFVAADAS